MKVSGVAPSANDIYRRDMDAIIYCASVEETFVSTVEEFTSNAIAVRAHSFK